MTGGISPAATTVVRRRLALCVAFVMAAALGASHLGAVPARAAWTPAHDLGAVDDAVVVIDSTMTTHRAWTTTTDRGRDVMAAQRAPGADWSAPVRIHSGPGSTSRLRLLPGAAGSVTLVWAEGTANPSDVLWSSQRSTSGEWGPPVQLSGSGEGRIWPSTATNARGDMVVVWAVGDLAMSRTARAGEVWSPIRYLALGVGTYPDVGIADDGTITYAWRAPSSASGAVAMCQMPVGGTSCSAISYAGPKGDSATADVAVGPQGHRAVSFDLRGTDGSLRYHVSRETAPGVWSPALVLPASPWGGPSLAVDAAGTVTVAAPAVDDLAVYRSTSSGWSQPHTVPGSVAITTTEIDPVTGLAVIGMSRLDSPLGSAVVREVPGGWAPPDVLGPQPDRAPGVSLGARGGYVDAVHAGTLGIAPGALGRAWDDQRPSVTTIVSPTGSIGVPLAFEATADDWLPTRTSWTWGDGTTSTGARATHTYDVGGVYTVTSTTTDAAGNTTSHTHSVHVTQAGSTAVPGDAGTPVGTGAAQAVDDGTPAITRLRLTRGTISRGARDPRRTRARITTTAPGTVRLAFRKRGSRKVLATLTRTLTSTSARVTITAKVGRTRLRPGRYTITAVVTTPTGSSRPVVVRLRVVR